jgi:programmed cell death 6-interacting protein
MQASTFYECAWDTLKSLNLLDQSWTSYLQIKIAFMKGKGYYYCGLDCALNTKYGEGISWLSSSILALKSALDTSLTKHISTTLLITEMKMFQANVDLTIQRANKDNDVIYMQAVPTPESLNPIMPARMVNPTAFPNITELGKIVGKPFFNGLVPLSIHQAASKYAARKDSYVNGLIAKLQEAAGISHSTLASLRLPMSIQALEQPIGLSSQLIQRNEEVRAVGGPQKLTNGFETLSLLAKKNWELLREVY